jgi:deoxycytidylate deaminase
MLLTIVRAAKDDKAMKKAIEDAVEESGLLDITEFGRAVHAEMAALMTCVRQGVSARNCTLFCTTFPCHNCAKHIIAAGISEVLFIEPYPKSRALSLHDDALSMSCSLGKVILRPFVGVGPRRYPQLFALQGPYGERVRRKDSKGIRHWDRRGALPSVHDRLVTYLELEDLAVVEFAAVVDQLADPRPAASDTDDASSAADNCAGDLTAAPGKDTRGI